MVFNNYNCFGVLVHWENAYSSFDRTPGNSVFTWRIPKPTNYE